MQRRDFLKSSLTAPFFSFSEKNVLLYNYVKSALHSQVDPSLQASNDCVSHAIACGVEVLQAIEHFLGSDIWYGPVASEFIHVGTIKKFTNFRTVKTGFPVKDGIKFIQKYGVLFRRVYGNYDFTNYKFSNCQQLWRRFPNNLLLECKKHPVKTAVKVSSWEEAKEAIHQLRPVIISSSVGFVGAVRDEQGFVKPKGTRKISWKHAWKHAWTLIGIKERGRSGGCLMSSHGKNWVNGPKGLNQPDGSIWVDASVLHEMVKNYGVSYAIADLQ